MADVANASRTTMLKNATAAQLADWLLIVVVVLLPWSTSATLIAVVLWAVVLLATLEIAEVRREFMSAVGGLPVALVALFLLGMLWADASYGDRVHALGGIYKLLAIPFVLIQIRRSDQAPKVLMAFMVSCTALLGLSWGLMRWPWCIFRSTCGPGGAPDWPWRCRRSRLRFS
jgi:hypothetical protein